VLHVHGANGPREEPLGSFFLGPGKTTLKPGDIVTAIQFPLPPKGCAGIYLKLGRNQLSDLSIVGVTAFGHPDSSCPSGYRFRLALASVAPVPLVPAEAETYLANHSITPESLREAARLSAEACSPIDDVRGSARYRKQMAMNLSAKALSEVWKNLN
jgi:carbon-monoxide dehydrogenase medium subunit